MLTGTAPASKPGVSNDSLAVVRAFAHNAKPLLDSLTALHFARLRISFLEGQVQERERQRDFLAVEYQRCRDDYTKQTFQYFDAKEQLGRYRQKHRRSLVEVWLWRIGTTYFVYKKICPSCPP